MSIEILIILTVLGIVASACFSGFENGIIAVRQARLDHAMKENSAAARLIQYFRNHPSVMLSTILLGNNLCNCFTAIFFDKIVKDQSDAMWLSMVASAVLTIIVLVFGEVTPKLWFRQRPFFRCRLLIYPMYIFHLAFYPFVWTLSKITSLVNRLLGDRSDADAAHMQISREEFGLLVSESKSAELIDPEAAQLMENALHFHDRVVSDIMIPAGDVRTIAANATLSEAVAAARRFNTSRFPVTQENGGKTWIGIFNVYDAIFRADRDSWEDERVIDFVRPLVNIPEAAGINLVLTISRNMRSPILVVRSNHSEQSGIVTPMDVTYPLVGRMTM